MKKFISTSIFAVALLVVGACSNNTGKAQAETNPDIRLSKLSQINSSSALYRYVDCENRVAVYFMDDYRSGVAVVNNINLDLLNKKCGNQ